MKQATKDFFDRILTPRFRQDVRDVRRMSAETRGAIKDNSDPGLRVSGRKENSSPPSRASR